MSLAGGEAGAPGLLEALRLSLVAHRARRAASDQEAEVATLLELANARGLTPMDLDDAVYDVADATASGRVNDDATFASTTEAQDHHYGLTDLDAADVNNGGLEAQVRYLVKELGAKSAREAIQNA
ncbi:hypothetical protein [Pseudactinotalea terrae]|uniref:hypothetical protein n=1 Tax=Pseudactinotalea terrae TaxID=1743262 RepID=UPI0012E2C1E3|nr:hypothetical protein [Pseudactinotalea terrae]